MLAVPKNITSAGNPVMGVASVADNAIPRNISIAGQVLFGVKCVLRDKLQYLYFGCFVIS